MPVPVSRGKACSRESQPLAGREMLLDGRQLSPRGHSVGSYPGPCHQPSTISPDSHETRCPGGREGQGEICLGPPRGRGRNEGGDEGQGMGVTETFNGLGSLPPVPPNPGCFSGSGCHSALCPALRTLSTPDLTRRKAAAGQARLFAHSLDSRLSPGARHK